MQSIGGLLKEKRLRKKISLTVLEEETKIKKEFIIAIENGNWKALPEFPVTSGFVRNLSSYLGVKEENSLALLRRDFPPKKISVSPKPDIADNFKWNPRSTFFMVIGIVIVLLLSYLLFQYIRFISPPKLIVNFPQEGISVKGTTVKVSGFSVPYASILVNNQPVLVNDDGSFTTDLEVKKGEQVIEIKSTSRSGLNRLIYRKIRAE